MSHEIRLLSAPEVPLLLPLARQFFAEGNLPGKLNPAHFVQQYRQRIENGIGFVLVAGVPIRGTISGVMYADAATAEPRCAEEFWFVGPQERGTLGIRLFDAWEAEATRRGAVRLIMSRLTDAKGEKIARLYEARGYQPREQFHMREVTQ